MYRNAETVVDSESRPPSLICLFPLSIASSFSLITLARIANLQRLCTEDLIFTLLHMTRLWLWNEWMSGTETRLLYALPTSPYRLLIPHQRLHRLTDTISLILQQHLKTWQKCVCFTDTHHPQPLRINTLYLRLNWNKLPTGGQSWNGFWYECQQHII